MRLIVAGTRYFNNYQFVKTKLDFFLKDTKEEIEIVSGACDTGTMTYTRPDGTPVCGADGLGERYAAEKGYRVVYFEADWDKHGKSAGPIRNKEMADYASHAVVFWDGASRGSMSMIEAAQGIPTRVVKIEPKDFSGAKKEQKEKEF